MKRMKYNETRDSYWLQVVNKGGTDVMIAILDIIECYPEISNTTMRLILKTAITQHVIYYINRDALNAMYSIISDSIYKYARQTTEVIVNYLGNTNNTEVMVDYLGNTKLL